MHVKPCQPRTVLFCCWSTQYPVLAFVSNKTFKSSGTLRNPFWTLGYCENGLEMSDVGTAVNYCQLMATPMPQNLFYRKIPGLFLYPPVVQCSGYWCDA